jgi:hypothetical protein
LIPYLEMLDSTDIIFTNHDHDTDQCHTWNITRVHAWLKDNPQPVHNVRIDPGHLQMIVQNFGIEPHRFARVTPEMVMKWPVIFVAWPDGKHTLIDGAHRFARCGLEGCASIPAHVIPSDVLEPFEIDIPQEWQKVGVKNPVSGIP